MTQLIEDLCGVLYYWQRGCVSEKARVIEEKSVIRHKGGEGSSRLHQIRVIEQILIVGERLRIERVLGSDAQEVVAGGASYRDKESGE